MRCSLYDGALEVVHSMTQTKFVLASLAFMLYAGLQAQPARDYEMPKAPTDVQAGSITYENIPYPYPVSFMPLTMYGQDVRMAYMDVPPEGQPNGRTVVLLHGMNF